VSDSAELVYAVPRRIVFDGTDSWLGVRRDDVVAILERVERDGAYVARPLAEIDRTLKQIIPYLVLRDRDRVYLMKRTKAGGDARLHDRYSIGVGGHMNPGDETILGALTREWREELVTEFVPQFQFLGLLNDDTVEVGIHHLGVVFVADALGRSVEVRETHKLSGSFEPLDAVRAVYDGLETWSQLVFDALVATESGPTDGITAWPNAVSGVLS
jgi:predicted NUDIX family phosphoesterase